MTRLITQLTERVRRLPREETGNVLLLSGIMAFLVTMLSRLSLDSSQAVYNRILAQNAADGAAETAALWQARGLNLLQMLNNFHFNANAAIYTAEMAALIPCDSTPGNQADEDAACTVGEILGDELCAAAEGAQAAACGTCSTAGPLNDLQGSIASFVLGMQSAITDVFPFLEFFFANDVAQMAGGDSDVVLDVMPQYAQKIGSALQNMTGLPISSFTDVASLGSFSSYLPAIYAVPLPISGQTTPVSLNANSTSGNYWPWKWNPFGIPEDVNKAAALAEWEIGKRVCQIDPWQMGAWEGSFDDHDSMSDWGWDDSYYSGHPGYMTWVAGKTNETELAGLGFLRWLNGSAPPAEVAYSWMNQTNLPMYTGSIRNTDQSSWLTIPAVLALASSQVEGSGVTTVDTEDTFEAALDALKWMPSLDPTSAPTPVDSRQTLIRVYFPGSISGEDFLIWH